MFGNFEDYVRLAMNIVAIAGPSAAIVETLVRNITNIKSDGRDPTDEEWNALFAIRDSQSTVIDRPIPGVDDQKDLG